MELISNFINNKCSFLACHILHVIEIYCMWVDIMVHVSIIESSKVYPDHSLTGRS